MKKFTLTLLVTLLAGMQMLLAQDLRVTGIVSDASGAPLPGVTVVVEGTSRGTTTLVDGTYVIPAPANATLRFSFVGMVPVTVPVNNRTTINVVLESDTQLIDDVIVVAYGTVRREAKTGSVTAVSGDQIAESAVSSMDKALAGKMAGVTVTATTGQPGAASQIRIRGASSINAGNEPLWVVDGIPVMQGDQSYFTNTSNALAAINTNDIESITILKDAAAASVYGSRAANGVILVTTKSGKEGQAKFTVRAKYGFSELANDNNYGVMSGEELYNYQRQAVLNAGREADMERLVPSSILSQPMTDWVKHLTRKGKFQEYEVNASGGNSRGKYYSSLSYHKNEGIYYGTDYQKFTARVNADYKLTNTLETGTRINVAYQESNDIAMQNLYYTNPAFAGLIIKPWTQPYTENGQHSLPAENSSSNPRATAEYDQQFEKQYRFIGNMFLQWTPLKNLVLKTTNGVEGTFGTGRRFWGAYTNEGTATSQDSKMEFMQLTTSNTIEYNNVFEGTHSLRLLAGQEAMKWSTNYLYAYSPGVDPDIPYPGKAPADKDSAGYSEEAHTLMSFFGILDYSWNSKYYLQASIRTDGSSLFGSDSKWGTFWSASASWNIHNEDFMQDVDFLNLLKLRASYGVNGNNNIARYRAYGVYATSQYNGNVGMLPSRPANNNLSWEKNKTFNIGLDFGLFDNKFTGSIDYYQRRTEEMLLNKDVPQTTGFSTNFMNIGEIKNSGLEFQLEGDILRTNDMSWTVGANIAFNSSEVIDLGDNEYLEWTNELGDKEPALRHAVGQNFLTFYVRDYYGVNPLNGEALWRTADGSLTNTASKGNFIYSKSPEPKFTGGFNTTFSWKGLSLGAFFEFKGGNYVLIAENSILKSDGAQTGMNQAKSQLNYWKQPGDTGVNPKPVWGNASSSQGYSSTRRLEKGDYVRIKDITLSYSLPQKWIDQLKIGGVKVYVSGYNLFTWHDVDFWDPERGIDGMGIGIYPMTKSIIGGIEISF